MKALLTIALAAVSMQSADTPDAQVARAKAAAGDMSAADWATARVLRLN